VYTHPKISDTICSITESRQKEVRELAKDSDLTVVVGSRNSSNTVKLFRIAAEVGKDALLVENASDLAPHADRIRGANSILITAGASAPGSIIQEVTKTMADIREEVSFAELLEASFKTLHTGDKVTGIVSAVSASELKVDLGTKHTGILVYDEITDESGIDLTEKYHVGDSIDVVCIKFSDSDGTVQLSSKRLDVSKHWDAIKAAHESGEILSGVVKDIIRKEDTYSGVVVTKGTSRVFIPASQTGIAKGESLDPPKGQKVNFKVIDINEERKRAVGSIKAVLKAEKKQAEQDFYASIEVGQKFVGTVRALMNYGAFVNIGPVDGMVHISELS
jgi:4-hydroxy-3-methylbut-2-enyl diphosphate reductase